MTLLPHYNELGYSQATSRFLLPIYIGYINESRSSTEYACVPTYFLRKAGLDTTKRSKFGIAGPCVLCGCGKLPTVGSRVTCFLSSLEQDYVVTTSSHLVSFCSGSSRKPDNLATIVSIDLSKHPLLMFFDN